MTYCICLNNSPGTYYFHATLCPVTYPRQGIIQCIDRRIFTNNMNKGFIRLGTYSRQEIIQGIEIEGYLLIKGSSDQVSIQGPGLIQGNTVFYLLSIFLLIDNLK